MEKGNIVHSYTLRCHWEQPSRILRIYLRQVQTGEERYFSRVEDAMEYIKQQLEEAQMEQGGG